MHALSKLPVSPIVPKQAPEWGSGKFCRAVVRHAVGAVRRRAAVRQVLGFFPSPVVEVTCIQVRLYRDEGVQRTPAARLLDISLPLELSQGARWRS